MLARLKVRYYRKRYFSKKLQLKKKKKSVILSPELFIISKLFGQNTGFPRSCVTWKHLNFFANFRTEPFLLFFKQQFSHDIRHIYKPVQLQKQPYRGVLTKRISNETALCHGCSPVNLLQIFRTSFPNNTFGGLLLQLLRKLLELLRILKILESQKQSPRGVL